METTESGDNRNRRNTGALTTGLLWYDSDQQRSLPAKIGRAAARYHQKYGRWPDTCHVHPAALGNNQNDAIPIPGSGQAVTVSARPNILKHHLWIGETE